MHELSKVRLLLIVGADDPDRIVRKGTKVAIRGSTDFANLLGKSEPYHRLHVTRNFFRQSRQPELDGYQCLVNLIAEPERNSRVLENLRKLLRNVPGKVVNRPEAVLRTTRDQISRHLAGIPGMLVPRSVRLAVAKPDTGIRTIERSGLNMPIILRQAGTHGGKIVGCFDDVGSLRAALAGSGDHIATEFIDFRSPDGLYRKYRVFFIGPHMIFRHKLASDDWNVHAKDRERFMAGRPEIVAEEEAMFADPTDAFPPDIKRVLEAVRARIPLDFFGMDFAIGPDGQIILFEANAAMSFFPLHPDPQFAYLRRALEPAQRAFRELLGLAPEQPAGSIPNMRLAPTGA